MSNWLQTITLWVALALAMSQMGCQSRGYKTGSERLAVQEKLADGLHTALKAEMLKLIGRMGIPDQLADEYYADVYGSEGYELFNKRLAMCSDQELDGLNRHASKPENAELLKTLLLDVLSDMQEDSATRQRRSQEWLQKHGYERSR